MKKHLKNNTKAGFNPFTTTLFIILIVYSLALFILIGWALMKSMHEMNDFVLNGLNPATWPGKFTLQNYVTAFSELKLKVDIKYGGGTVFFGGMLINSLLYSLLSALAGVLSTSIMAYLTIRIRTFFNKIVMSIFFFTLFVPIVGSMPSTLQIMNTTGLMNTWFGVVALKCGFTGMYFLIYRAAFESLSGEYAEAAKIDGAGRVKIMFGIEFPLIRTILMIAFTISFINFWNDYQTPMVYIPKYPTAAYGLWYLRSSGGHNEYIIYKLAGYIILIIPSLILFLFVKDYMIGNLTIGGVKG